MEKTFRVEGMSCGGCVASVERAVTALPGIEAVSVTLAEKQATVRFDDAKVDAATIRAAIEDAGYDVPPDPCHPPKTVDRSDKVALQKRLARVEGQVRAVREMVTADRYCVDVITQIQAARSALAAVAEQLLEDHLKGCVARAMQAGEAHAEIEEVLALLRKFR